MENLQYLFAAYTAIWVILFLYISRLHRRERFLASELEALCAETTATAPFMFAQRSLAKQGEREIGR